MNSSECLAAIDIGSNTVKIKIAKFTQGNFQQILYKDFPSNLSKALNKNKIIDLHGIDDLVVSLLEIKKAMNDHKVDRYKAVATEALRAAKNKDEIVETIRSKTGIAAEVISNDRESELTLSAVLLDVPADKDFICVNGGGGSTELILHRRDEDLFFNLKLGAVTVFEEYFKHATGIDAAVHEAKNYLSGELKKIDLKLFSSAKDIVALGGSIYNAAYIHKKDKDQKFNELSGMKLSVHDLQSVIKLLICTPEKERKNIPGMNEKRSPILLPGLLVHYCILKYFHKDELQISTRTIGDGLLIEIAGKRGVHRK